MIERWLAALTCAVLAATGMVAAAPSAAAAGDYTITVSIAPQSPRVGDSLTVTAHVSGGTVAPTALAVKRTDRNGMSMFSAPMSADTPGEYSAPDPMPAVWGTLSYAVTVPGDMTGSEGDASTYVKRLPANLTISASRKLVATGHRVSLTAHLGSMTTNRTVTIYARPYDRDRRTIRSGVVDASGDLSASYTVLRRTRFTAAVGGDETYQPATVHVVVRARAIIRERLRGYYATSGAYRIYHRGRTPELDARLWPNEARVCLFFRAQYYSRGAWHNASLSPCVRTDAGGRAAALLHNALALPYRLRAEWHGSRVSVAYHGPWLRLRFR